MVSLEWETRSGYDKPGAICLVEYDPVAKAIRGRPQPIWRGGTDRGCLEGPHLTKHNDYYYLMCAEGGTGYYHCVTMARAKSIWGPYKADPQNPILRWIYRLFCGVELRRSAATPKMRGF